MVPPATMKMNKHLNEDNLNGSSGVSGDDNIDEIATTNAANYIRRRKCNEKVPVCEKTKRRDSIRRVR